MKLIGVIVAAGLLTSLAACQGGKAPTGQVVATVDGDEITISELQYELAGASSPDPKVQKRIEAAALQAIVNRRILAKAARERQVDKTPAFAVQQTKNEDIALVQGLEQKIAAGVPAPSAEEAERFVAEHPDSFEQRKLFAVDQLVVPQAAPALVKRMQPLTTLPQIEALLNQAKVPYQRANGTLDGAVADPELIAKIARLPAGEVFVVPVNGGVAVNQVRETRLQPIARAASIKAAEAMLKRIRTQQLLDKQLGELIRSGGASVKYNGNYAPAPAEGATAAPKV